MGEQILTLLPILGAVSLAIACALWAAASNAEARRIHGQMRTRLRDAEGKVEQTEAVLSADPGLILIWGEAEGQAVSLPASRRRCAARRRADDAQSSFGRFRMHSRQA